jgi:hypothetical protein
MRYQRNLMHAPDWMGSLRLVSEYAAAVGLALLFSYWIVQGRW